MNPSAKKILQISGLAVFFILILVFAFSRSKDLIFGVQITKVSLDGSPIQSGTTIASAVVKITGNAKNAINLTLDGREISIDQQGNWSETIALLPGYNIINIKARDKFGNIDEKNYQLMH